MRVALSVIGIASLAACGDGSAVTVTRYLDDYVPDADTVADTSNAPDVETVPIDGGSCGNGLRVLSMRPWPGGGLSIAVELTGPDGAPGASDGAVVSIDGQPASIASAWQPLGVTGIVLLGDDRTAARALVQALPDGETFVVWRGAMLLAEATTDKRHVLARIDEAGPDLIAPIDAPAWAPMVKALVDLGGADAALAKTLVVSGSAPQPLTDAVLVASLDQPDLASWLVARRSGLARIGTCARYTPGQVVAVTVDGVACHAIVPEPLAYLSGEACNADAAARDAWPWGSGVDIVLTPDELAVYETRKADLSKDDFSGSVRLGAGEALPATLHFRGQTSLDCERKSFNIDLAGPDARRLVPGAANDELYLIAMCKDVGYYNQLLGDTLAAQLGIFPLARRLVTVHVNEQNLGVYLLLEHPTEAMKDGATALEAVIRRGLDQDGNRPEVQLTAHGDDASALASYDAMVASADDIAKLEQRLDLDHYLTWIALAVLLQNGDYVDEVFFEGALEAGASDPYYRILAWDPDDLWSECHRHGNAAIPDEHGIMYCVEADIDHVLFADPVVYDRFVTILEGLLDVYTIERLTAEMAIVRDDLFAAVGDDATAAAMLELVAEHAEAATKDGFRGVVEDLMNSDLAHADEWLDALRAKVDAYRESH